LASDADEQDAMSDRVAVVPFDLVIGNRDPRPVRNDTLPIRDNGDILIVLDVEAVGLSDRMAWLSEGTLMLT
jgi:hypothetical protein